MESVRLIIVCPRCLRLTRFISYGLPYCKAEEKELREQRKKDYEEMRFKCKFCELEFDAKQGWKVNSVFDKGS